MAQIMRARPRARGKPHSGQKHKCLICLTFPALLTMILFVFYPGLSYLPAAFKNWIPPMPLSDAKNVGMKWFREILGYYGLPELIRNSVILGIWDIALLPVPLALALASHHCGAFRMKKALDIFSLIPFFIPSVIVVAITQKMLSTEGLINQILAVFGVPAKNHLLNGNLFYVYFSLSGLWSGMGFSCLVYKACLTASSAELHAAAQLDGANLLTRIIRIDLPLCRSSFLVNLTFQVAGILCTSTERLLLFKNTANSAFSTTLDLYAYELSFRSSSSFPQYSKAIALSLLTMVVNLVLLFLARKAAAKTEDIYG